MWFVALLALVQFPITHQPLSFDFGDFKSNGELTSPVGINGKVPAVILVHGTGPADKDSCLGKHCMFKALAEDLSSRGFAVVRYNKHYVSGPAQVDRQAFFSKANTQVFVRDLERVLEDTAKNPKIDRKRIFLYGWSEGTAVAAAVVARHPEVAGLILQGAVSISFRDLVKSWFVDVAVPYLRQTAGATVDSEGLKKARDGSGGLVAKLMLPFFMDPAAGQSGKMEVSSLLDANHDGRLDLDREVLPRVGEMVDFALAQVFPIYGKGAIPSVLEHVGKLRRLPILILQGEYDANTPVEGARELAAKLKAEAHPVELKVYQGLGHALSAVPSRVQDASIGEVADGPRADLLRWLEQTARLR